MSGEEIIEPLEERILGRCALEDVTVKDGDKEIIYFRSGKMGPYAILSSSTKIISEIDNFFNTKLENDEEFSYKDGDKAISFFKNDKI
jgi:hypothetical protein